ncbi:hypothetical protein IEQ34_008091 [Dendrobium chrysotoxum]|uniref:Uncharacterized protein n=1 Tax=Dendrobium chrysotoxum TaxID=161865 RepID=A0AAV7H626_DENCH|nr:hypothetical protein IEQ34_008091 [Dendrobium chrysotoxum]
MIAKCMVMLLLSVLFYIPSREKRKPKILPNLEGLHQEAILSNEEHDDPYVKCSPSGLSPSIWEVGEHHFADEGGLHKDIYLNVIQIAKYDSFLSWGFIGFWVLFGKKVIFKKLNIKAIQ